MNQRLTEKRFGAAQKSRCASQRLKKRPRLSRRWEKAGIDDHGIAGAKKRGREWKSDGKARRGHPANWKSLAKPGRSVFKDRRKHGGRGECTADSEHCLRFA